MGTPDPPVAAPELVIRRAKERDFSAIWPLLRAEIATGETFTCTAVDADGATWDFNLTVKSENSYEITDGAPRP